MMHWYHVLDSDFYNGLPFIILSSYIERFSGRSEENL